MTIESHIHDGKAVIINKEKFNKSAKRLNKEINSLVKDSYNNSHFEITPLKLSAIQECLAKSLGFKDTYALTNFFDTQKKTEHIVSFADSNSGYFLNDWEVDNIIQLFSMLMEDIPNNIQKQKGISLITIVVNFLKYMQTVDTFDDIIINISTIEQYSHLDNLIKVYKTRRDFPPELRNSIRTYLMFLPTYQETAPKQNDVTMEQHGYIQMQLGAAFNFIRKLEKKDPLIINPHWYEAVYKKEKLDIDTEGKSEKIHLNNFTIRLEEDNISEIAKPYSKEAWNDLFTSDDGKNSHYDFKKFEYEANIFTIKNAQSELITLEHIRLNQIIKYNDITEDTWLQDPLFKQILLGLIRNKNFKSYYLSDLINYSFKILNPQKQKLFKDFILHCCHNYPYILSYSQQLNALVK